MDSKILIIGGGDIAQGIYQSVGGKVLTRVDCDVVAYWEVDEAIGEHKPEVVINCAGISHVNSVKDSDPDDWFDEIETNLIGSYHVAKASVEHGVKTLIFIASVAGLYGKPEHSGYSASKGGVISLVQSLAMEGHNAYAVSPGRVDTKMREKDYPGEDKRTRLTTRQVGDVVKNIINGQFEPGDNIIVRKIGFDLYRKVDKGEPWKDYLKVGQEKTI